jgi:hypothetical protein
VSDTIKEEPMRKFSLNFIRMNWILRLFWKLDNADRAWVLRRLTADKDKTGAL